MVECESKSKGNQAISETDRDMLRSILKKDNDRITEEIRLAKSDVILELGFEGGGIEVTRYTTPNGKVYFRNSGSSMRLDHNDDEEWVNWQDDPVTSFDGALLEMKIGIDMLAIRPILIHRDFSQAVREHIEALYADLTPDDRRRMGEFMPENADAWLHRGERLRKEK